MLSQSNFHVRRRMLTGLTFGAASLFTPGVFAELLSVTPRLTEGPFYPDQLPLDQDNDLIVINDNVTPAVGEIAHLTGRVMDQSGAPLNNAVIEIWQCDAHAVYLHTADSKPKEKQRDKNFQGFGRFTTNSQGQYRFRTIKPVPYPGRPAPHIHVKIKQGDRTLLITQLMIRGHEGNLRDGVFADAGDLVDRELLLVDFNRVKESKIGEYAANFDIVLGKTPDDAQREERRPRRP